MIFAKFQEVVQKHEKSQTAELWYASRSSVFIGFKKKIRIWATFTYIYNISYERQDLKN